MSNERAVGQGWTFTESVQQSGQCIPYPPYPSVVFATKSACEAARQSELANNGEDWSVFGDGSCVTIITCTPCVGSDAGTGSGSGGPSLMGNPGEISFTGLLSGNAFFTAHDSKAVEAWIYDYLQRMNALGIEIEGVTLISPGDVPLTGNAEFDRFYAEQMMQFSVNGQGNAVYLNDGANKVDPNDLKNAPAAATVVTGAVAAAGTVQIPASSNTWYHLEPLENGGIPPMPVSSTGGSTRQEHPRIELVREASVTLAGWLPDGAAYPGILAVNVWAENAKSIQDIRDGNAPPDWTESMGKAVSNTLVDWKEQAIGDLQGKATDKFVDVVDQGTGIVKLASSLNDYNDKWQDLGGETAGGEGDGIFGKITKAALWLGQPAPSSGL